MARGSVTTCHMLMPLAFIAVISPSAERRPKTRSALIRALMGMAIERVKGMADRNIMQMGRQETPRARRSVILKTAPMERTKTRTRTEAAKVSRKSLVIYLLIVRIIFDSIELQNWTTKARRHEKTDG